MKNKVSKVMKWAAIVAVMCLSFVTAATGQSNSEVWVGDHKVPENITTPDKVETRLGTLEFFDGFPTKETTQKVYDNLDFMRGVEVFLNCIPGASLSAFRAGLREMGCVNRTVAIFEDRMDAKALWLTPNASSIYFTTWIDLKEGPVVIESPPNVLILVDDFWFRYVGDMGNAGPDRGKGGKYLYLPPGYEGNMPAGYHLYRSRTYGNWLLGRGYLVKGSPKPAVDNIKGHLRIYPLSKADNPPATEFKNMSGVFHNTIHANNFDFYKEVNTIVQEEPADALDPERTGLLASIGIKKGQPFAPDARMKKILNEAAAVGNATARAIVFETRNKEAYFYENSAWKTAFIGNSHEFINEGARLLDARTMMHYYATGITPAMSAKIIGKGAAYALATVNAEGNYFDGSKTYKAHLPPNIPAANFWSFTLYDNQTRAMLPTDVRFPSVSSDSPTPPVANADGSFDIFFGPKALKGKERNWIQTVPGRGWTVLLRLYGPGREWFDKTWRPSEIEKID